MKFEEIISSFIMVIVTGLVLVGFTIAWYSNCHLPAVTGLEVLAAEMGSVQVALKPEAEGGMDISELEGDERYAEIGIADFTNVDAGELAPGVYGQVTFYVKPITSAVKSCNIIPMVRISQDGSTWYPVIESVDGSSDASGEESGEASGSGDGTTGTGGESGSTDGSSEPSGESGSGDDNTGTASDIMTIEELYALANSHIEFFWRTDEGTLQKVTAEEPYKLTWTAEETETEKPAVLYWEWHYEYPFTAEEEATLSAEVKEGKIDTYDEEDMIIGNNISAMKFYFTFSAQ